MRDVQLNMKKRVRKWKDEKKILVIYFSFVHIKKLKKLKLKKLFNDFFFVRNRKKDQGLTGSVLHVYTDTLKSLYIYLSVYLPFWP